MAGESKTTTDHDTVKEWVEARGGVPATIKRTENDGKESRFSKFVSRDNA